jgi:nickel-dependent lactate racemase
MRIQIPYGQETVSAELDWARCLGTLDIADVPELPDRDEAIRRAIECPIGLDRDLYEIVAPGESVAILVSDAFRQTRVDQVLPILLEGLNRAGIPDEAISIVFATGTHRPPTGQEQAHILGAAIYRRFKGRRFVHDPYDPAGLVDLGLTSRGTPVAINRRVHEADRVIATGAVVFHYFGGFGGGRKSIVPGIASVATIAHNHALNLDPHEDRMNPAVRIGALDGNPVAEDMLEAARMVKVDYVLNTVLNRQLQIAAIFAGELEAAHRAAAEYARKVFAVTIRERADLVVATSGGAKNFVQSHKALYNAFQTLKPGGRVIFLCQCPEGLGGEQFVQWLRLNDRARIFAALRKQAEINGQTALSTVEKAAVTVFVTEMTPEEVALMGGRKASALAQAIDMVRVELAGSPDPTFYLMPSASYTVPFLEPKGKG